MDIRFDCPRCGQNLSVEERGAGMLVNCPNCKGEIEIPRSAAPSQPQPPPPTEPPPAPTSPPRPPPPPPIVPPNYLVARNGVEIGKFESFDFMKRVENGEIRQDDWFWMEGMSEWKRVAELKAPEKFHLPPRKQPTFAKCDNCGRTAIAGIRDQHGTFCSTICRDYAAYPGFCKACIDASTPVSSGHNITLNGVGGMFYGSRDQCPTCGSIIRTQWFCILFIPIFRIGKYRIKYVAPNRWLSRELPGTGKHKRQPKFSCPMCGGLGFHLEDCPAKLRR